MWYLLAIDWQQLEDIYNYVAKQIISKLNAADDVYCMRVQW